MKNQVVTVLLIEKDAAEAARIRALLAERPERFSGAPDIELLYAPDPLQAKGARCAPDVILFSLPGLESDPTAALKRVRNDLPAAPVVVLNRHPGEPDVRAVLQAGAVNLLESNPLNARILYQAIIRALAHRRVQQESDESEVSYRRLVENSQDLIYRYRFVEPCGFEYVSSSATKMTGYTPEEHYADPDLGFKLVYPEDHPLLEAAARGELPDGQPLSLRWQRKDGAVIWTEQRNVTIFDSDGNPIAIEGIARDVTERVQAVEGLAASEAELRALFAAMRDVVIVYDADGRYLKIAPTTPTNLYRPADELLGKTVMEVLPPEQAGRVLDTIRRTLETQEVNTVEYSLPLEGKEVWFSALVSPLSSDAVVWVARDITARLEQEKRERRSQRLESIGTLAGGLAHDLNNALAPIALYLDMLRRKHPDDAEKIEVIASGVKRAAAMVRQMLTFAKGEEGERVLVQLNHLLKEMQTIMAGTFPKNIQIELGYDASLPAVLGDATQLHQVLFNLCVNARDAMPHGGTLRLETSRQEVDSHFAASVPDAKPGSYVRFRVKDTGVGIEPAVLERIFEPFFTTKTPDKGTGLGLSTTLGIVRDHGGFLHVDSEPGHGATFDVHLPFAEEGAADAGQPGEGTEQFRGRGETILLVDDEAAMREIGRAVLDKLNYTPVLAGDGRDGLEKLAEHRSHVRAIIVDLHMPEMDGLAFVRALRRTSLEIPVIVTTGYMENETTAEFQALGVINHLDKPFTEAQLAQALSSLLAAH